MYILVESINQSSSRGETGSKSHKVSYERSIAEKSISANRKVAESRLERMNRHCWKFPVCSMETHIYNQSNPDYVIYHTKITQR
jgi:hypothetical protein